MSSYRASLEELLNGMNIVRDIPALDISAVCLDSRDITKGCLFIALKGAQYDARKDLVQAFQKGAAAVLIEAGGTPVLDPKIAENGTVIEIPELSASISRIAGRFYGHPSRSLKVIGVTGTNGKTTVVYYLAQMLQRLGLDTGLIGTLGVGKLGAVVSTGMTTPDAVSTQKALADLKEQGVDVVCMEVSSHGLELGRVNALKFEHVVLTNLSQDHLDFHHSMEAYSTAKQRLFETFDYHTAVINADDEMGQKLLGSLKSNTFSVGINAGELRADQIELKQDGLYCEVYEGTERCVLSTQLIGQFNLYNLLSVLGVGRAMGCSLKAMADALVNCEAAPGRMERIVGAATQTAVVVDYAHTPDALEKALLACQSHCQGSLSVVFGCGGDRDKTKRPIMGEIAEKMADHIYLTDDNPRTESADQIVADIVEGMQRAVWVLHDREQAIRTAIRQANAEDWVLIAGKGHESEQIFADHSQTFDDRLIVRKALEQLAA